MCMNNLNLISMKKLVFVLGFCILAAQFTLGQIKVASSGNVGLGTSNLSTSSNITAQGTNILFRNSESGVFNINFSFNESSKSCDISPTGAIGTGSATSLGGKRIWDSGNFNSIGTNYFNGSYLSVYTYSGYRLDANYISCQNFYNYSDKRLKKNINTLPFNRSSFSKLSPVSFDMSDSLLIAKKDKKNRRNATTTHEYGFIAQEIQDLYPQLVIEDDSTGYLKIKPLELLPILVKALHDQQAQIDALTELVTKSNSGPKKVSADMKDNPSETDVLTYPVLDQNIPNPFNTATTIGLYLPSTIGSAAIYVYDMNGVQLKNYSISERGKSTVTIQGSEFKAGMYLYALIADGKVIDTKRMILTK